MMTNRWFWWTGIVLVSLFVMVGTVRMLRPQMDERLYAKYRNLPKAHFVPADGPANLREICAAYNLKQYSKALSGFRADTVNNYLIDKQFFSAICQLELNNMKAAEELLQAVAALPNPYQTEALWYMALSHLRRHDRRGCVEFLKKIPADSGRISPETVVFSVKLFAINWLEGLWLQVER